MRKVFLFVGLMIGITTAARASVVVEPPENRFSCEAYSKLESRTDWGENRGQVVLCSARNGDIAGFVMSKRNGAKCEIVGHINQHREGCGWCGGWLEWCGHRVDLPCGE